MNSKFAHLTTPGGIFTLVRDGHAHSRADLSRITGLAPSTVALRVDALLKHGFLQEAGDGESRGGRRPRKLSLARDGRVIAGVDMGIDSHQVVLFDLAGQRVRARETEASFDQEPELVLRATYATITELLNESQPALELVGVGLALPGPVSLPDGRLTSPSRMPGWNGADPAGIMAQLAGVPVRSENDANAMAWSEFITSERSEKDMIVVKADSSIGMGIIADGSLYRGSRGMAGDVSHTIIADAPQVLCSCGRFGCLDVLAGGHAMVRSLASEGEDVSGIADVIRLATDGHPRATHLLRESGLRTGAVLATLVSFLNPRRVVLAGALAQAEAFVAGVRSSVYDLCLPLSTNGLELSESRAGTDLGARGVAALLANELLSPHHVDSVLHT